MKMKKMALKTASFLAAASLLTALPLSIPDAAYNADTFTAYADETEGDLRYIVDDDHVVITGCSENATDIKIPESIGGKPVTAIDDYAFDAASITSVTIPDSVKTIGNWSFSLCTELKSLTIPDSVEYIGIRAFEMNSSLTEVNFPDHMIEIDSLAFEDTPWLTAQRKKDPFVVVNGALIDAQATKGDVVIPSSIKYVSPSAFARNENITSVVFPSSVKKLNDSTFFYCTNLTSADLRYVTEIEGMSFAGCEKLKDLKLSGKLTSINYYAFADIKGPAEITVFGSKSDWEKVEKSDEDEFLNNATYKFDESVVPEDDVKGDVNDDGELTTADLVLMSKWLLGTKDVSLKNWEAGDFISDGRIDTFDLVMMRKAVIEK